MKKKVLFTTLFVVLFAAAMGTVWVKIRGSEITKAPFNPTFAKPSGAAQNKADTFVTRMMNSRFSSITRAGNKVNFVGGPGFSHLTKELIVGQGFRQNDRHFSADYSINKIDSEGVLVNYHYSGTPNLTRNMGRVRSGQVKLKWK